MHQWLSFGGSDRAGDVFAKREFSFTLANDIYIRFLSYNSLDDWKADMVKKVPHKIDMGAVYTKEPNQKAYISKDSFKEVAREFILDIDLTDYQEDGTISTNCIDPGDPDFVKSFRFMKIACKVLDAALREDFGFKHLLWVFSGRRGIHCWVADERARLLPDSARTAVAEYLNVFKGGDKDKTKLDAVRTPLHPALDRAYEDVLRPEFYRILEHEEQGWFEAESMEKMLDMVGDPDIKQKALSKWRKIKNPVDRWRELEELVHSSKTFGKARAEETIKFIIFKLTYPRLDIAVSKMMNHLLKSPFCVHPKTERICVPFNPQNVDEFDPNDVPSLEDILRDMEANAKKSKTDDAGKKRAPSSPMLDRYVKTFRKEFVDPLVRDHARAHRAEALAF